jgi:hypothetical protein
MQCRIYIDDTERSVVHTATEMPKVGQTIELNGDSFIVRMVVPVPEPHASKARYVALVFCHAAPA